MEDQFTLTSFNKEKCEINKNELINNCLNIDEFKKINRLGEGTFGVVYKAIKIKTNEIFALKKCLPQRNIGIPLTTLREISILKSIKHNNIIQLYDIAVGKLSKIYLVMEYCEIDLNNLIQKNKGQFDLGCVKFFIFELLSGLSYLHENNIIHRDLKTSNLLLNKEGCLKISDFGSAKKHIKNHELTPYVGTLWYRAPEILLGLIEITNAIDIWSCGCVLGELILNKVLFNGKSEIEQLNIIVDLLGTPSQVDWPKVNQLPFFDSFILKNQTKKLNSKFNHNKKLINLLDQLLCYNYEKRITANDALKTDFFITCPLPWKKKQISDLFKTLFT